MLVSQPDVSGAEVGVYKSPDKELLRDGVTTAGPLDQQHVLERLVGTHFTHITNHHICMHFMIEVNDPLSMISVCVAIKTKNKTKKKGRHLYQECSLMLPVCVFFTYIYTFL